MEANKKIPLLCAIGLSLCLLVACGKNGEERKQVNPEFLVDKLFTTEGCTVYRFSDAGSFRYFTNCGGSASWQEGCGKSCTRQVEVPGGLQ
jgi:hypothetical protein